MINWSPACCDCGVGWAGNIELVTVRNGAVTRVDTIWNRTQGFGQYPAFNADAQRIAFYRWAKAGNGKTCTTIGGTNYITVMNRDGSNPRNIIALQSQPYGEMALNWPAGDWIYYIRNKNEIRRVDVNTGSDQSVCTEGGGRWYRRFEMTMDGAYGGFQTYGGTSGDLNGVKAYPFTGGETKHFAGCNAAISASGRFGSNYFAGWHTEICFNTVQGSGLNLWLPLYDKTVEDPNWNTLYPNRGNINEWLSPDEPVFNGSTLQGGMSAECMRWAANSDKWILQMVNHYGLGNEVSNGSNCVAANWIDKAAFLVSHNPKQPLDPAQVGTIFRANSTGDMWVDGGVENLGKWEDTTGAWHAVPGFVPTGVSEFSRICRDDPAISITGFGSGIRIMFPTGKAFTARIIDVQGRTVLQRGVTGDAVLRDNRLRAGVYQVIMESGSERYSRTLTLAQ